VTTTVRARVGLSAIFFVNGVVLASWVAHIPEAKARHGISDGGLGIVLLSMAGGAVLALPLAGWLVGRFGSRPITCAAALALCLALPLPVLSPSVALLALSLALLGVCNGMLDVSMNAQAVLVEARYPRPIMSSLHGLWSVGCVAGAGVASVAMAVGAAATSHVLAITVVCAGAAAVALRGLLPSAPPGRDTAPVFVKPPAALLGLGLLTFCGLLAEGAMGDWSAVYLHDGLGTTPAVAATGFAAFALLMAAGRFGGDRLASALGPRALLRASGAVAAAGLAGALVLASPPAAVIGFGLVGLGIGNVVPVVFSAAGRVAGFPAGTALAAVATTGYTGYLAGPPLIGLAAKLIGLPVALGLVGLACTLIAVTARALPASRPQRADALLASSTPEPG
jgi:MFS family permease